MVGGRAQEGWDKRNVNWGRTRGGGSTSLLGAEKRVAIDSLVLFRDGKGACARFGGNRQRDRKGLVR